VHQAVRAAGPLLHRRLRDLARRRQRRAGELDDRARSRKLLYHEARHIGWDEGDDEHDPKAVLVKPDLELFLGEIADVGLWNRTLDALSKDFQQPGLVERSTLSEQGFLSDWGAMQWADTGVLVLPSGRSAHLEAGYFSGAGKALYILMQERQEPELMYRMASGICLSVREMIERLSEDRLVAGTVAS
jgi:hypothetical protein